MRRKWFIYTRLTDSVLYGPVGRKEMARRQQNALNNYCERNQYGLGVARFDGTQLVKCWPKRLQATVRKMVGGKEIKPRRQQERKPRRPVPAAMLQMELF